MHGGDFCIPIHNEDFHTYTPSSTNLIIYKLTIGEIKTDSMQ